MRTILRLTALFALASVLIAASMISYDYFKTRQAFPPNTYIYNIDVSTLTQKEAKQKLKSIPLSDLFTPFLSFEAEGKYYPFPPEEVGVSLLLEKTINDAFKMTHKDNYLAELQERISAGSVNAPLVLGINHRQLTVAVKSLAEKIETSLKDASVVIYEESGGYHIEPHVPERKVDIIRTTDNFKVNFYKGKRVFPIVINYTYPTILEEDLREYPPVHRLSSYTTYYGTHDSPNRIHNIKLVASWIDGTLLMPDEIFSVAEVLGDVLPEQGFKEALVIMGDELEPQVGGGACQIATTLYNTVSLADLKILQRRNHSFYFNIYPLGRDAAVYPPHLDLRFENDTGHPLLIRAEASNKKLSFRLYGTPSQKRVQFSKISVLGKDESGKYVPMSLKEVIEKDLPFKTETTRRVYDKNWKKIKEEKIKSFYKMYGDKENVPIRRPESQ
jgi:vancomycin resistance protein YoaR